MNTLRIDKRSLKLFALAAGIGVTLAGCSSLEPGSVPIVDRSEYSDAGAKPSRPALTGTVSDSGRTHTVAPGDTLYNISLRYGLDPRALAQLNAVTDPTQLRLGQVLHLPPSVSEPRPAAVAPGVRVSRVTQPAPIEEATVVKTPTDSPETTPVISEAKTNAPAESAAAQPKPAPQKADAGTPVAVPGTRMLWPARGPILADFAKNGKGLDIGGTEGSIVVAAGDGQVLFVGDGVKGYGNLVIIKHTSTLVTAYGHNSKVVVKLNDRVKAGQKIAELGKTDAPEPMLRFEVRDKGKPVDPMKYLAPRRQ